MPINQWFRNFTRNHIVAPDPYDHAKDVKASEVLATKTVTRVYRDLCQRPRGTMIAGTLSGQRMDGWRVVAQNDKARVEVLIAWIRTLNREGSSA